MMAAVRKKRPLVMHITNYVTVNDCANITLCAGGSPVMTSQIEDAISMVGMASSLVLNIGTPDDSVIEAMVEAGRLANELDVPVILDPVGFGATPYRTDAVDRILDEIRVSVIKGNEGEISNMAGLGGKVRGVDSDSCSDNASDAVKILAERTGSIVAMTGKNDRVSDGNKVFILSNGSEKMTEVSGTGCMASSVVGCYVGTFGAGMESVAAALSVFSIAGEMAAEISDGPGSFKSALMDCLYNLTDEDITSRQRTGEL